MQLRPYQEVGRDFLASRRHALLADAMRVGKTPQAILAAEKVNAERVLVVCPAIAVPQWHAEFRRWWQPHEAVVRSYDKALREDGLHRRTSWDVVIADECHFAGNPEAKRTKLVYGKDGLGWSAKRLWALSGTPAPKSAASLWPMLRAFGIVGMTYAEFLYRYCTLQPLTLRPTGTRVEMIPELRAQLAKCMLRRTRKDVAPESEEIAFNYLNVEPKSRADYKIPAGLSDDEVLAWAEAHSATDREDRIAVAMAKVDPLVEEIVGALEGELYKQTVVFGWHTEPLMALVEKLRARGVSVSAITGKTRDADRTRIQVDFRRGRLRVVVANILAAGTAIDLSAASHAYMLELDWVPANNVQAVHRLVSMDKEEKVTVDVVTWPGSCDDWLQRVLLTRVDQLAKLYA